MRISSSVKNPWLPLILMVSACGDNFHLDEPPALSYAVPSIAFDALPVVNSANAALFDLSGTCSEDGSGNVTVFLGSLTPVITNCVSGLWQLTGVDLTSLADGSVSVRAEITDVHGQRGSALASVNKDVTAPTVSIAAGPVNQSNQGNYSVSGTCSDDGLGVIVVSLPTWGSQTTDCVAGAWSLTNLDVSGIADALGIVASVQAQDAAGNTV